MRKQSESESRSRLIGSGTEPQKIGSEIDRSERDQLVREILDAVSARLSAIALTTAAELSADSATPDADRWSSLLIRLRSLSVEGMEELRAAVVAMHEPRVGAIALPFDWSALPELISRCQAEGAQVSLHGQSPSSFSFPKHVGTTGFLAIEEILDNSAAEQIMIRLAENDGAAVTTVSLRPGPQAADQEPISMSLRDRVRLVGGHLVSSTQEDEYVVVLTLPLRQE